MHRTLLLLFAVSGTLIVAGCSGNTNPVAQPKQTGVTVTQAPAPGADEPNEVEIRAAMAKLDPADRKLAEAQKWCAVQNDSRLGSMEGGPFKIMLDGQPVFLCCGGCKKKAESNPEKTLAKVAELKKKAAAETKTP